MIERTYNEKYIECLINLFNELKEKYIILYCNENANETIADIETAKVICVNNNFLKIECEEEQYYIFLGDIIGFRITGDDE